MRKIIVHSLAGLAALLLAACGDSALPNDDVITFEKESERVVTLFSPMEKTMPDEIVQEILDKMAEYQSGAFEKMMELNPSSVIVPEDDVPDADAVSVVEKEGTFTLSAGKSRLDEAVAKGRKFVAVKVSGSEPGGEDSFMNFTNM